MAKTTATIFTSRNHGTARELFNRLCCCYKNDAIFFRMFAEPLLDNESSSISVVVDSALLPQGMDQELVNTLPNVCKLWAERIENPCHLNASI